MESSRVFLAVDHRESSVVPFLEEALGDYPHIARQINTGDYLICRQYGGALHIHACVERKSLPDFAASLKDGRYSNVQKMVDLRATTGCQLYYFVEGPAFPKPERKFSGIPYKNILAAMTSLMVRYGAMMVLTENEQHTAHRLADFLGVYEKEPFVPTHPGLPGGGSAVFGGGEDGPPILDLPSCLTDRINAPDSEAAAAMWAKLPDVSIVLGAIISRQFSIADLVDKRVSPEQIKALRTAAGRAISKKTVASLLNVRAGASEPAVKLLSGIQGISAATASEIIAATGGLAGLGVAELGEVQLRQKSRTTRLGPARAAKIYHFLNYKYVPDSNTPPPAAGVMETRPLPTVHTAERKRDDSGGGDATPLPVVVITDKDLEDLFG